MFIATIWAYEFKTQKDSYFVPLRTKIFWTLGSGIGLGNGFGYGSGTMGTGNIELVRILGKIKPQPFWFEYVWSMLAIGYGVYQDEEKIDELIPFYTVLGFGVKLNNKTYPWKFVPYTGFGTGIAAILNKKDIDTNNPQLDGEKCDLIYVEIFGIEWYISKEVAFFAEQRYLWGKVVVNDDYIPNMHDLEDVTINNSTFKKQELKIRQFNISIGVRFYWGLDIF